eukprot:5855120-Ditylum_brightwellii.AAC.2
MGVVSRISWRRIQGISSSCQVVVEKGVIREFQRNQNAIRQDLDTSCQAFSFYIVPRGNLRIH